MTRRIHTLHLPLVFPAGIAPGAGGDYNTLVIARNGRGEPVLRGTALAGILRHAWEASHPEGRRFFGSRQDENGELESPLAIRDCVLQMGASDVVVRTHHLRDRHRGSVADGGLYELQVCPPGTRCIASLVLRDDAENPEEATGLLQFLLGLLQEGLPLGGKANRGIGLAQLDGQAAYRSYDLSRPDQYANWLDDDRQFRQSPDAMPAGDALDPDPAASRQRLRVDIRLGIPRGQDLLIGDGQGMEHDIEPQRAVAADGRTYWRLPGSSLRGLFRSWITRLAARDGASVADNVQRQARVWKGELNGGTDSMNGANLGWCFLPQDERKPGVASTDCPAARLFGTLFQAGRMHLFDAYAPCSKPDAEGRFAEEQHRRHVAVDALTGGAAEGMLFDNTVLTAMPDGRSPQFKVTILVENPSEQEAAWLAKTIRALDLGVLRVGSSKSAGRLALTSSPVAKGPHAELLGELAPAAT